MLSSQFKIKRSISPVVKLKDQRDRGIIIPAKEAKSEFSDALAEENNVDNCSPRSSSAVTSIGSSDSKKPTPFSFDFRVGDEANINSTSISPSKKNTARNLKKKKQRKKKAQAMKTKKEEEQYKSLSPAGENHMEIRPVLSKSEEERSTVVRNESNNCQPESSPIHDTDHKPMVKPDKTKSLKDENRDRENINMTVSKHSRNEKKPNDIPDEIPSILDSESNSMNASELIGAANLSKLLKAKNKSRKKQNSRTTQKKGQSRTEKNNTETTPKEKKTRPKMKMSFDTNTTDKNRAMVNKSSMMLHKQKKMEHKIGVISPKISQDGDVGDPEKRNGSYQSLVNSTNSGNLVTLSEDCSNNAFSFGFNLLDGSNKHE